MLGNEYIIEQFVRQAETGSLSHAYLITGKKGMGKKELAKLVCLEVFCREKRNGRACGNCPDCKKVLSGNHPDILRIRHEKPHLISVDDIREQVSDTVGIRPYEGGKKIYIIDEAQKMNIQAQNALLKSLEEPPEYVLMFLLCDDERMLLDTIRSRCIMVRPEQIGREVIRAGLEEKGADPDAAQIAAAFSAGNPGRALELAFSEDFRKIYRTVVDLCRNLRTMDAAQRNSIARELAEENKPELVLELIEDWYRDLLYCRITGSAEGCIFQGEQSAIRSQASGARPETVSEILAACEECAARIRQNVNKELSFYMLFQKMRDI